MITNVNSPQLRDGVYSSAATYFGLSTDAKPTGPEIGNGSCYLEMDSGKIWFYDAENSQWLEWGA